MSSIRFYFCLILQILKFDICRTNIKYYLYICVWTSARILGERVRRKEGRVPLSFFGHVYYFIIPKRTHVEKDDEYV